MDDNLKRKIRIAELLSSSSEEESSGDEMPSSVLRFHNNIEICDGEYQKKFSTLKRFTVRSLTKFLYVFIL